MRGEEYLRYGKHRLHCIGCCGTWIADRPLQMSYIKKHAQNSILFVPGMNGRQEQQGRGALLFNTNLEFSVFKGLAE